MVRQKHERARLLVSEREREPPAWKAEHGKSMALTLSFRGARQPEHEDANDIKVFEMKENQQPKHG